jgi:hypothetical protein
VVTPYGLLVRTLCLGALFACPTVRQGEREESRVHAVSLKESLSEINCESPTVSRLVRRW